MLWECGCDLYVRYQSAIILARGSLTYTAADLLKKSPTYYIVNDTAGLLENCTLLIKNFSKILKSTEIYASISSYPLREMGK